MLTIIIGFDGARANNQVSPAKLTVNLQAQ